MLCDRWEHLKLCEGEVDIAARKLDDLLEPGSRIEADLYQVEVFMRGHGFADPTLAYRMARRLRDGRFPFPGHVLPYYTGFYTQVEGPHVYGVYCFRQGYPIPTEYREVAA